MPGATSYVMVYRGDDGAVYTPLNESGTDPVVQLDGAAGSNVPGKINVVDGAVPNFDIDISDGLPFLSIVPHDASNTGTATGVNFYYSGGYPVRGYIRHVNGTWMTGGDSPTTSSDTVLADLFLWIPDQLGGVQVEKTDVTLFRLDASSSAGSTYQNYSINEAHAHRGGEYWEIPDLLIEILSGSYYNLSVPAHTNESDTRHKIDAAGCLWYRPSEFTVPAVVAPDDAETFVHFKTRWSDDGTQGGSVGQTLQYDLDDFAVTGTVMFDYVAPVNITLSSPEPDDVFASGSVMISVRVDEE